MGWDGFQRAALAELGHVLYRLPDASPAGATTEGVAPDAPMLARLARAAGVAPDALLSRPDIAAQSAHLRGNADAKRALWPRLRAMRRESRA